MCGLLMQEKLQKTAPQCGINQVTLYKERHCETSLNILCNIHVEALYIVLMMGKMDVIIEELPEVYQVCIQLLTLL